MNQNLIFDTKFKELSSNLVSAQGQKDNYLRERERRINTYAKQIKDG